jgi:hypothetical protein
MNKIIILSVTACALLLTQKLEAQVEKKVVLEHFTNTYCGICASRNPSLYTNLNNNPDVLHLAIHPSRPYRVCELYLHNTVENDERTNFYGILGSTPRIVIQGNVVSAGTDYNSSAIFNGYKEQTSSFSIQVTTMVSDDDSLVAKIRINAEEANTIQSLNLYAPAVEDTIFFNAPNGETEHFDVLRKVLINKSITNLPKAKGDSIILYARVAKHAEWDKTQMYVMAILQDETNKSVEQVGKSMPIKSAHETSSVKNQISAEMISLAPNPFQHVISVQLPSGNGEGTITNNLGQVVHSFTLTGQNHPIDLSTLSDGVYAINIQTKNGRINRKIIKQEN